MRIAIILPAHNEEQTIAKTINAFHQAIEYAEIWVIDNASTDETLKLAEETFFKLKIKGGILQEPLKGKGNALRRAFHYVNADIYVMADADMTYPAHQVLKLIEPVSNRICDIAVGDRISNGNYKKENKRHFHTFGNLLIQKIINFLYKSSLTDIMSGYRAMSGDFIKTYPLLSSNFEVETDMTLHALDKKFKILEIPINYKDRENGSVSKLNTIRDGFLILLSIFNITRLYKPLFFYCFFSILFILLGIIVSLPVLYDFYTTSKINRIPSAILATGLEIVGFLFLVVGLILDSVAHHHKRMFEITLLIRRNNYN